jgi:hypothetical protein
MKLWEYSKLIRSKNAGPFELTFDIILDSYESYLKVCAAGVITAEWVSRVYRVDVDSVNVIRYPAANAIKVTIPRPVISGDILDTDVYGGQQHAPFVELDVSD